MTFFAEEQTDRNLFGWFDIPASAFQSVNPILIVALAPLFAMLWVRLGKKNQEPASPMKQSIGLFMVAVGYVIEDYVDPNWGGFSIEVESGEFDLASDITVSFPTTNIPSSLSW